MADKLFTVASHGPVTRQDLRDELNSFAASSLKQSLPDIATIVRHEVQQGLRAFLLETPCNMQQHLQHWHQEEQQQQYREKQLQQQPLLPESPPESRTLICLDDSATLRDPKDLVNEGQDSMEVRSTVRARLRMNEERQVARKSSWRSQLSSSLAEPPHNFASSSARNSTMSAYWTKRKPSWFSQRYSMKPSGNCGPGSRRKGVPRGAIKLPTTAASPETRIGQLVSSATFNYISGFFVVANAVSIGLQTDMMAKEVTTTVPDEFEILEKIFCAVFTTELVLRIVVNGSMYFRRADWMWNVLDAILVLLQLGEQILGFFADVGVNKLSMMRILRILRLVRIVRMVRILRFIGELRTLVASLAGSIRSLCWTVMLLILIMYVTGVCLTQVVADERAATNAEFEDELVGSLGATMITLYQVITGGVSWKDITDMPDVGWFSTLMISLYVAFVLFALMNIVTGVFLESALSNAKRDQDLFLKSVALKIFLQADKEVSGSVTWEEFEECLAHDEVRMYCDAFGFDAEEAKKLFVLLDPDRSGRVAVDDFILGTVRLRGPARAFDLAVIGDAFRNWSNSFETFSRRMELIAAGVTLKEAKVPVSVDSWTLGSECNDIEVCKTCEDGQAEEAAVNGPLPQVRLRQPSAMSRPSAER